MAVQLKFKAFSMTYRICKRSCTCTSRGVFSGVDGAISICQDYPWISVRTCVPCHTSYGQKLTVGGNDSVDDDCDLLDESEPEKPCEAEKHQERCEAKMVLGLTCKELEETATCQLFRMFCLTSPLESWSKLVVHG